MENRLIRIRLRRHVTTGLLMAISEDMPGLIIHARTEEEVEERMPALIRDLLEMEGREVLSVEAEPDAQSPKGFEFPDIIARAALAKAACA